jgi:hypothetical protein
MTPRTATQHGELAWATGARVLLALLFAVAELSSLHYTALAVTLAYLLVCAMPHRRGSYMDRVFLVASDSFLWLSALSVLAYRDMVPGLLPASTAAASATYAILFLDTGARSETWLSRFVFHTCFVFVAMLQLSRLYSPLSYLVITSAGVRITAMLMWVFVAENILRGWVWAWRRKA